MERVEESTKTSTTSPSALVNTSSPWKMASPAFTVTSVPSAWRTVMVPDVDSTWPMGSPSAASPSWAYWPGAMGPASLRTRSDDSRAPSSVMMAGGDSVSK